MFNIIRKLKFEKTNGIDEESFNKAKNIIEKERSSGYGEILILSGGTLVIENLTDTPSPNKNIVFKLHYNSENDLNKLISHIFKEIDELGYEYSIELPKICIDFNDVAVDSDSSIHLKSMINKKRQWGCGHILETFYDFDEREGQRQEFIYLIKFSLKCQPKDYDILLNEILNDVKKLGYDFNTNHV